MASDKWSQCLCIGVGSPQLARGISVSLYGMRRHSQLSWLVKPLQV